MAAKIRDSASPLPLPNGAQPTKHASVLQRDTAKHLAPRVKFARERDRPLPDELFDDHMTDIGSDSDPDDPTGANATDISYTGKDKRLYYELKAQRDERKHEFCVERRKRERVIPRWDPWNPWGILPSRRRPSWFSDMAERVQCARGRDETLEEEIKDGELSDLGEDTDADVPGRRNAESDGESDGDAEDSELYYDCKSSRERRKHQLRVDRQITKIAVARDQKVEAQVMVEWKAIQEGGERFMWNVSLRVRSSWEQRKCSCKVT